MIDDRDESFGARDVFVEDASAALIENRALGSLEDGVVGGVSLVELARDFFGEIVFFVFGFPIAVREFVGVNERSVENHRGATSPLDSVFGDKS
ncbi:MAG TPA: hypothetical protein VFO39_19040 [Candidatus Sulfotelmatobacter sp.]|nr:hypothetical protein [Candidatus Sulfotelmatobacter sp.]